MRRSQCGGFTLVELLVASVIGLILIFGFIRIYLSIKTSYQIQHELAQMQDSARLATQLLEEEIHAVGYIGCPKFSDSFFEQDFNNSSGVRFTPESVIQAKVNRQLDSDELFLQQIVLPNTYLMENMTNKREIFLNRSHFYKKNEVILIGDCKFAEMAVVDGSRLTNDGQLLQLKKPLHHYFKQYAFVGLLQQKKYFIKPTGRITKNGLPILGLFVESLAGVTEEIASGIAKMKISVTERTKNNTSPFVSIIQVKDFHHINAVKINLLLESDAQLNKSNSYYFNGQRFQTNDRRFHQEWSFLAAIRSRLT